MYPQSSDWYHDREAMVQLAAPRQGGARVEGRVNPGERSVNIVNFDKPKVLTGLRQTGTVAGPGTAYFPGMGIPSYRWKERTYPLSVTQTEHGKPVELPTG